MGRSDNGRDVPAEQMVSKLSAMLRSAPFDAQVGEFLRGTWEIESTTDQSAPPPLAPVFSEPLAWLPEAELQLRSLGEAGVMEGKAMDDDAYVEPTLAMKLLYGAFFLEAPKIKATHL